ncbi:hypothetical protein B0T10DRAFT_564436 [Thelonectria olida]|uniref:Rhodopsin domain-containing protein n=1 Tax=Thelonectria olida TaxID=1576542 RepID=A0A9P9AM70_9HYPO|nr:hypothetical protein B0T10DRAFT_564436 [Thelonectria olida]
MSTTAHTKEYLNDDKGPVIVAVILTVCILSTVFVAARLFTRKLIMGTFNVEDWLTIAAVLSEWGCIGITIEAVKNGNGRHFDTLDLEQKQSAIFYTVLGFPFGIVAFGLPKLAVAALLIRIMNPERKHRIILWVLPSVCMAGLLVCVVILFVRCSPVQSQWDFSITDGKCWSPHILVNFGIFAGALSAFTDLYLAVYPAVILWSLQMGIRKKIALSVALGVGSISTVVAIYKCTRLPSLASMDFSYDTSDLTIWTVLEASTIIIASCIPTLQPFVEFLFGRRALGSSGRSGYKNYSSRTGAPHRSDIELEHSQQSRSQNKTANENAKYMGSSSLGATDVESQESILQHRDRRPSGEPGDKPESVTSHV